VEHVGGGVAHTLASVPKYNDNFCINGGDFFDADDFGSPIEIWLGENYEHTLDYTFLSSFMNTCEELTSFWEQKARFALSP